MDDLQDQAEKLRGLGDCKPNSERMSIVREALSSKWEGVQSIALRVLGQWGGEEAIQMIRRFLEDAFAREHGWSIRGVAIDALVELVGPDDVDWVLELYFSRPGVLAKHELLPVVLRLAPARAKTRLFSELSSSDPTSRQAAAKAIGNMAIEDGKKLLKPLLRDKNKEVRATAEALSADDYRPINLGV